MSGAAQLYVRHNGKSYSFSLESAGLSDKSTEQEVFAAAAKLIGVEPPELKDQVVVFRPSGDIVVRPEAVYGADQSKKNEDRICRNCSHCHCFQTPVDFNAIGGKWISECRRYPPTMIVSIILHGQIAESRFPEVKPDQRACGEFFRG